MKKRFKRNKPKKYMKYIIFFLIYLSFSITYNKIEYLVNKTFIHNGTL